MRKMKNVVLLLLAFLCLHGVAMAQSLDKTEEDAPGQDAQASNESIPMGSKVTLAVDGGSLSLVIPQSFQLQNEEIAAGELYPERYLYVNGDTGEKLVIHSHLSSPESQQHLLDKIYDKTLNHVVFENVAVGNYTFRVYAQKDSCFGYTFLLLTENGYSYRFYFGFEQAQSVIEIPVQACSILSTLEISANQ